jgi:2-oxoglutarate dehydrogenase E2 component (dihydrolipoamide succinyltransferase)
MAQIEVKVPQLSESVAEATMLAWHKKVGEPVSRDENLIDIETDKVVLELPAPADGVIIQIIKGDGSTVVAGEVIAIIDTEAAARVSPRSSVRPGAPAAAAPPAAPRATSRCRSAKILPTSMTTATSPAPARRPRVTTGDVLGAIARRQAAASAAGRPGRGPRCSRWPRRRSPAWASVRKSACR